MLVARQKLSLQDEDDLEVLSTPEAPSYVRPKDACRQLGGMGLSTLNATLLGVDPGGTDWPDLSGLAENGLALLVPTGQMPAAMPKARLDMPPHGHPPLVGRVDHLFGHKLGVDLPDVLTIALDDPAVSLTNALSAEEGLGDLDLDDVAVLAGPLWAIPATDRAGITRLCKHP